MNILLMGNLRQISTGFLTQIEKDNKCIIYDGQEESSLKGRNVIHYIKEGTDDEEILKVFAAFDFDFVIFFSGALDGAIKIYDELEKVESAVYAGRKSKVGHFIYVTTNDLSAIENSQSESHKFDAKSRQVLLRSCEELFLSFAEEGRMKFLVLKIPYLYNMENQTCQLTDWICSGNRGEEIKLRGSGYQETDFLCDEDLGGLLARIIDEPCRDSYSEMWLSGENPITLGEFSELLKKYISNAQITYKNHEDCVPCRKKDGRALAEYGWYPKHILEVDVEQLVRENAEDTCAKKRKRKRGRRAANLRDKVRIACELIAVFILAEMLNYVIRDNVLINFIDFRLIFVVIAGTMNGLSSGVAAAVLSCLGYVVSETADMQWQVIFYNVENWLPFACYFLLGAISGYTKDKHEDEVLYAREEHELLEKKYTFLNGLYNHVLESKDSFNSQIIGYKDSFGKVYSAVKKLDTVLPDKVFYEAVNILEELLENHSVAIYTIDSVYDFARLNVCSKQMSRTLNKSLKMSDYPILEKQLYEGDSFVNTDCLKGYPAYAAPIHEGEKLMGMILLMNSGDHRMNMEFLNKFNIISDLISDSLIRAMEFECLSGKYVQDTQILTADRFREVCRVKEQMREKQYQEYVLLRLHCDGMELKELSDRVCRLVRSRDILGVDEKNDVFLLLNQAEQKDLEGIGERLKRNGITFENATKPAE